MTVEQIQDSSFNRWIQQKHERKDYVWYWQENGYSGGPGSLWVGGEKREKKGDEIEGNNS